MRKLNKTEQKIMDRLNERGSMGIERCSGRGPEGGKVSEGGREWNAGMKLVKDGLVRGSEIIHTRDTRHGYTIFHASRVLYKMEETVNG